MEAGSARKNVIKRISDIGCDSSTIACWNRNGRSGSWRAEEAVQLYDERFGLMWEFYLAACEIPKQGMMNFQVQLTKRLGVVPMTRNYIAKEETRLRARERGARPRLKLAGE